MGSLCESKNIPKIPDKNIKENQISKITDEDIMKMNKEYNNIKIDNRIYYDDIQAQEQKLSNFKEFLIELNYQLSDLKDQLHISVYKEKVVKNILTKEENAQILNNLDIISNNINEFENLIEKQKTFLQYLEYNFKTIQEKLYEIKGEHQSEMDSLNEHLKENEKIINNLKNNKLLYEQKRAEIEKNKKTLQELMEEKLTQIKKRRTKVYENAIMKKYIQSSNNSLFLKGSMLLGIKNSDEVDKFLKTKFIFKGNEKDINLDGQAKLVMKNWYEICHIYDDYDIYDITYEIKAVGLPNNMAFNTYTHNFISYDYNINNEILLFEIDGIKQTNYEIDKYTLTFNINLRNLESNKIHIKYKETLKYEKPKVVVLSVGLMRYDKQVKEEYNRLLLDKMKWSKEKIHLINYLMLDNENILSYFFPLLRYHDRITKLNSDDLKYLFNDKVVSHNGFLINQEVKPLNTLPSKKVLDNYNFNESNMEYLKKIMKLCQENNITLVLEKSPTMYPFWYDEYEKQIIDFANTYHLDYYNLLEKKEDIGLDFTKDTYDSGVHLNLSGAIKTTEYFGKILKEKYALQNHQNNDKIKLDYDKKIERFYGEVYEKNN